MRHTVQITALLCTAIGVSACGSVDRLANVGKAPALSAIENPLSQPGYKPVQLPMPNYVPPSTEPNSLWQTGARSFFKDQRARKVGDILTVQVTINDQAAIDNETTRTRSNSEGLGGNGAVGARLAAVAGNDVTASTVIDATSNSSSAGTGSVQRSEALNTNIAAVITQVLPNGNLVIEGRQEVRVNFEVRELIIAGVIRPEDISANNTIPSDKIAEARFSYGGRGQITDVQQPRYGQQVLDIFLPF